MNSTTDVFTFDMLPVRIRKLIKPGSVYHEADTATRNHERAVAEHNAVLDELRQIDAALTSQMDDYVTGGMVGESPTDSVPDAEYALNRKARLLGVAVDRAAVTMRLKGGEALRQAEKDAPGWHAALLAEVDKLRDRALAKLETAQSLVNDFYAAAADARSVVGDTTELPAPDLSTVVPRQLAFPMIAGQPVTLATFNHARDMARGNPYGGSPTYFPKNADGLGDLLGGSDE